MVTSRISLTSSRTRPTKLTRRQLTQEQGDTFAMIHTSLTPLLKPCLWRQCLILLESLAMIEHYADWCWMWYWKGFSQEFMKYLTLSICRILATFLTNREMSPGVIRDVFSFKCLSQGTLIFSITGAKTRLQCYPPYHHSRLLKHFLELADKWTVWTGKKPCKCC